MLAHSFTSGGRSFSTGFKALIPDTNPEAAFFKQHPRIFKMTETQMAMPDKAPAASQEAKSDDLAELGLSKPIVAALSKAGISKISQLKDVTAEALTEFEGIAEASAAKIVDAVNDHFEKGSGE